MRLVRIRCKVFKFNKGELRDFQKQAVIRLIEKKDKDF